MALDAYTALLLCRTDRCRVFEGHVVQRIRISLFVVIRSFADLKSHVFVKFPCLWILFVYCQFSDGIPFDAVSEQIFPDAFASFFGGNEKHFQSRSIYTHESNRIPRFIFRNKQVSYFTQCLRYIFLDIFYFSVR